MTALLLVAALAAGQADPKKPPTAGWPNVFPKLPNFGIKYAAPKVVAKDVYSQSAHYDWLGGRLEQFTITVARDPAFAKTYTEEAVRKLNPAPARTEVGKHHGWMWPNKKLVVVLAADTIVTFEPGRGETNFAAVAQRMRLDDVAKTLQTPPKGE